MIPCPKCPWRAPLVTCKGIIEGGIVYYVRCLKCKWEGNIRIPCEVTERTNEISDKEKA